MFLFLCVQFQLFANMANPLIKGTLGSRPFVSQYVDVTHEDLSIVLDDDFKYALFNVKYHINASKAGYQIPFMFYASEYKDAFSIKIDGKEVKVIDIPYNYYNIPKHSKFKDFTCFFDENSTEEYSKSVLIKESATNGFSVDLRDMIYFETNISEGDHIIEVNYRARHWRDTWGKLNKYSFRYALSPAKYWRSFGTLSITVDATNFDNLIDSNIGTPDEGGLDAIAIWHFEELPTEILMVNFHPTINRVANFLLIVDPFGLALMTLLILAICHFYLVKKFRVKYPSKQYSIIVILGSFLVPFVFELSWIYYYSLIDWFIGEHASRRHGHIIFVFIFYPLILLIYWGVFVVLDRRIKKRCLGKKY